jgi:hypothetical protein
VRRVTPASRARITFLLWCILIGGGAAVLVGALGEGSGSAPPVATREADGAPAAAEVVGLLGRLRPLPDSRAQPERG